MLEAEQPYLVNKMSEITDHDTKIDAVLALESDMQATVKMLVKVSKVMTCVGENDENPELDNQETDFKTLFPNHYKDGVLDLFGVKLPRGEKAMSNGELKKALFEGIFPGEKYSDYVNLLDLVKRVDSPRANPQFQRALLRSELFPETRDFKKYEVFKKRCREEKAKPGTPVESSLFEAIFPDRDYAEHTEFMNKLQASVNEPLTLRDPFEYRLLHANQKHTLSKTKPFIDKMLGTVDKYIELRDSLPDKAKILVDQKICTGRAMIDGVTKQSTFINTKDGVVQLSPGHKKEPDADALLVKMHELLKEMPFMKAVEIDKDVSLGKFYSTMLQMKDMTFEVDDPFEFKARKLGNYKASGLSSVRGVDGALSMSENFGFSNTKLRIVACDVNNPTSISHELGHYRDVTFDKTRENIIQHFALKMDPVAFSSLKGKYNAKYYYDSMEIIARLGEIGYLLNQFDYKEGETFSAFEKRVSKMEVEAADGANYLVPMAKALSDYAHGSNINNSAYFLLKDWSPEDLSLCKDYTHGFFYKNDPNVIARLERNVENMVFDSKSNDQLRQGLALRSNRRTISSEELVRRDAWGLIEVGEIGDVYQLALDEGLVSEGEFSKYIPKDYMYLHKKADHNHRVIQAKENGYRPPKYKDSSSNEMVSEQVASLGELGQRIMDINGPLADLLVIEHAQKQLLSRYSSRMSPSHLRNSSLSAEDSAQAIIRGAMVAEDGGEVPNLMKDLNAANYVFTARTSPDLSKTVCKSLSESLEKVTPAVTSEFESGNAPDRLKQAGSGVRAIAASRVLLVQSKQVVPDEVKSMLNNEQKRQITLALAPGGPLEGELPKNLVNNAVAQCFDTQGMVYNFARSGADFAVAKEMIEEGLLEKVGVDDMDIEDIKQILSGPFSKVEDAGPFQVFGILHKDALKDALINDLQRVSERMVGDDDVMHMREMEFPAKEGATEHLSPCALLNVITRNAVKRNGRAELHVDIAYDMANKLTTSYGDEFNAMVKASVNNMNMRNHQITSNARNVIITGVGDAKLAFIREMMVKTEQKPGNKLVEHDGSEFLYSLMKGQLASQYLSLGSPESKGIVSFASVSEGPLRKKVAIQDGLTYEQGVYASGVGGVTGLTKSLAEFTGSLEKLNIKDISAYTVNRDAFENVAQQGEAMMRQVLEISPNVFWAMSELMKNCTPTSSYGFSNAFDKEALESIKSIWYTVAASVHEEGIYASPMVWEDKLEGRLESKQNFKIEPNEIAELTRIQKEELEKLNVDVKPVLEGEVMTKQNQMRLI